APRPDKSPVPETPRRTRRAGSSTAPGRPARSAETCMPCPLNGSTTNCRWLDSDWRPTRAGPILLRMAETAPLADVARVAADDFRRGREAIISAALARALATAIELALVTVARAERRASRGECTRRAEPWG